MDEHFKYNAFISYNSKDVKWGMRLQRRLEWYFLPSKLRKEFGLKLRPLNPVFFAPTGIELNDLDKEIESKLRVSKNLIVICSPNAAQSNWIGKEIKYFMDLGRTDNIHFFIIDGEPNSENKDNECYHNIIRECGLNNNLGANIHEKNFTFQWHNTEHAYTQLISSLINIPFEKIWDRQAKLIKRIILFIISLLITLFFIFTTLFVNMKLNEKNYLITQTKFLANEAEEMANTNILDAMRLIDYLWKNNKESLENKSCRYDVIGAISRIDITNSEFKYNFPIQNRYVCSMFMKTKFSPDGNFILSANDNVVQLWSIDKKCYIWEETYDKGIHIKEAIFSPKGDYILVEYTKDRNTYTKLYSFSNENCTLYREYNKNESLKFNSTGETIFIHLDTVMTMWSLTNNELIWSKTIEGKYKSTAYFSPQGRYLVKKNYNKINIYSTIDGTLVLSINDDDDKLQFDINEEFILSHDLNSELKLWSIDKECCIWEETYDKGCIKKTIFSPKGDYILVEYTKDRNTYTKLYSFSNENCTLYREYNKNESLKFNPIGETILIHLDTIITMWSLANNELIWSKVTDNNYDFNEFSPNGKYLSLYNKFFSKEKQKEAELYSVDDGEKIMVMSHDEGSHIGSVNFSSSGNYIITMSIDGENKETRLWSVNDKKSVKKIKDKTIPNFKISPNEKNMIISIGGKCTMCEIKSTNKLKGGFNYIDIPYYDNKAKPKIDFAKITPDGKYLYVIFKKRGVIIRDYELKIWSFDKLEWLNTNIPLGNQNIKSIGFDVNGKYMAIVDSHSADVWSIENFNKKYTSYGCSSAVFNHDGEYILLTKGNYAVLSLLESGRCIDTLWHNDRINSATFSHDGEYILTASLDSTAKLWSVDDCKLIRTYYHDNPLDTAIFSLDDKLIVTVSGGTNIQTWTKKGRPHRGMMSNTIINGLSAGKNDLIVSCSSKNTLKRIYTKGFMKKFKYTFESKNVKYAQFTPDGNYLIKIIRDNYNGNYYLYTLKYGGHHYKMNSSMYQINSNNLLTISNHSDGLYAVEKCIVDHDHNECINIINIKYIESILNDWQNIIGENSNLTKEEKAKYHIN